MTTVETVDTALRGQLDTGSARTGQRPAVTGVLAVVAGVVAILALHLVPQTSGVDWYGRTISEYAYTGLGWVFNGGVLLVSVGSALVAIGVALTSRNGWMRLGVIALLAWSVALVVLVIFPKHDWSVGPSTHGMIHRVASIVAFLSVPIAALIIGVRNRRRAAGRWAIGFGAASGVLLGMLVGGFLLRPVTGTPWWQIFPLGLVERGIAGFAVGAVISLGVLALPTRPRPLDQHRGAARSG